MSSPLVLRRAGEGLSSTVAPCVRPELSTTTAQAVVGNAQPLTRKQKKRQRGKERRKTIGLGKEFGLSKADVRQRVKASYYVRASAGVGIAKAALGLFQEFVGVGVARQVIRKFVPEYMGNRETISSAAVKAHTKAGVIIDRLVFLVLSGEFDKGDNLKKCKALKNAAPDAPKNKAAFKREYQSMAVGFAFKPTLKLSSEAAKSDIKNSFAASGTYVIEGKFIKFDEHVPIAALAGECGSFFPMASLFGAELSECESFNGCLEAVRQFAHVLKD